VDALEKATARGELPNEHLARLIPDCLDRLNASERTLVDVVARKSRTVTIP